jgi:hypothetical protein
MSPSTSVAARRFSYSIILTAVMEAAASGTLIAQSTDKDHPTVVSSNEILGQGTSEKTDYYYAFSAEPGTVTLTFDVKADRNASVSGFDYEILDAQSKRLAGGVLDPVNGAAKRVVETVKVNGPGAQQLVLKLTITQSVEAYRVQLDRSVAVAPAASAVSGAVGGAVSQNQGTTPQATGGAVAQAAGGVVSRTGGSSGGSVAASDATTVAGGDASTQSGGSKLVNFDFGTDNKIQIVKELPSTGTLILEMKDGTTREILLKDVKTLTVKSQ